MKTLITGGAGFIGSSVVRELLQDGQEVRALVHSRDNRNLEGLDLELVKGDLLDPPSLDAALAGVNKLYHLGSIYAHWHPKGGDFIRRVNIEGTKNILDAAAKRDLELIIHTSSICTLSFSPGRVSTEADFARDDEILRQPYRSSKTLSERLALDYAKKLPIVIVNPASPIGVRDWMPTPTGRTILDFLNGKMFAYVDVGFNLIDVEDMAQGFVLAEKKGRVGERYVLGNHNCFLKDLLELAAGLTGLAAPTIKIPKPALRVMAEVFEAVANVVKKEPLAAVEQALHTRYNEFADCAKARAQLGLPQNDIRIAIRKAAQYYLDTGAVKPERMKLIQLKEL